MEKRVTKDPWSRAHLQKGEMEKDTQAEQISALPENGFPEDPEMGPGYVSIERIEQVYR